MRKRQWLNGLIVMTLLMPGCSKLPQDKKEEAVKDNDSKAEKNNEQKTDTSLEEAKETALNHADVSESEAVVFKANKDYEDGQDIYEIKFAANNMVYDYEISVADGSVKKMSAEPVEKIQSQVQASVTLEEAKAKALENAGVAQSDAVFIEIKLEMDDGICKYELDFYANDIEYSCEINGNDGSMIKMKTEQKH